MIIVALSEVVTDVIVVIFVFRWLQIILINLIKVVCLFNIINDHFLSIVIINPNDGRLLSFSEIAFCTFVT